MQVWHHNALNGSKCDEVIDERKRNQETKLHSLFKNGLETTVIIGDNGCVRFPVKARETIAVELQE